MIKKLFTYNKEDSLIRDGIILFSATMIANALGYLYHFSAGRLLGPGDYGVLGAILSLLYLINVPVNVIQTTLTKFTAQYKAAHQEEKINTLLRRTLRKMFILGVILVIAFLLLHTFVADFLHIPPSTLLIFSPILLFSLLMPVPRGILQGLQSFKSLGINLTLEGLVKCTVGIGLIFLGFKVYGAIIGVVLSILFAFLFTYKPLKSYLIRTKEIVVSKDVYSYAFPVFIALLILTSYYTLDVLLVKHYFPEAEAGYYAALSLIGKMIFFATFAIGNVMFPKVAEMHALNKDNEHLLNKSLFFMSLGALIAIIGYFTFSNLIVSLLFGKDFLSITPLVGWIGITMAFFSLTYLLSLYNLSINRTKFIYLLALFLILDFLFLFLSHDSLAQIVKILAGLMASLFVLLFAYTKMR